jgi:hypothetical protein
METSNNLGQSIAWNLPEGLIERLFVDLGLYLEGDEISFEEME